MKLIVTHVEIMGSVDGMVSPRLGLARVTATDGRNCEARWSVPTAQAPSVGSTVEVTIETEDVEALTLARKEAAEALARLVRVTDADAPRSEDVEYAWDVARAAADKVKS